MLFTTLSRPTGSTVIALLLAMIPLATPFLGMRQQSRDQDEPIKLKTDLVTVTAAVTDTRNRGFKALKQSDFKIYEDGIEQKIAHFAATQEPFSLMLLLDISGSTSADIALMKNAAGNFVDQLRAEERVGVIVFSRQITPVAELGATRTMTHAAIASISTSVGTLTQRYTSNTGTSFYDALLEAVERSGLTKVEGRKAIVCMSDGVDSTSAKAYREVASAVERAETSVYLLQLNTEEATMNGLLKPQNDPEFINLSASQLKRYFDEREPDSPMRDLPRKQISPLILREINTGLYEIARRDNTNLAERTGGRVYPVKSLDDLKNVYQQVAEDLRNQYSLGYYSSNQDRDGRWREIKVEVTQPGARVRARSGYWAAKK
jgi:Ca-activated chloride channel family protein